MTSFSARRIAQSCAPFIAAMRRIDDGKNAMRRDCSALDGPLRPDCRALAGFCALIRAHPDSPAFRQQLAPAERSRQ